MSATAHLLLDARPGEAFPDSFRLRPGSQYQSLAPVANGPSQLLIDVSTPEGKQSGLRVNSAVTCNNRFTVRQKHLIKTHGFLPDTLMFRGNECLKAARDLP